jgi:hypothetical protein
VDAIRHQNRKLFAAITGGDIRRTQIQCHRRRRCAKAVIARPQIRRTLLADFPTEGLGVFGDRDRMAKARLRGSRLGYLLNGAGFFHQPHRAVDDCHALLEILSFELPTTGTSALAVLLERARKKTLAALGRAAAHRSERRAQTAQLSLERRGRWQTTVMVRRPSRKLAGRRNRVSQDRDLLGDVAPSVETLTAFDRFSIRA